MIPIPLLITVIPNNIQGHYRYINFQAPKRRDFPGWFGPRSAPERPCWGSWRAAWPPDTASPPRRPRPDPGGGKWLPWPLKMVELSWNMWIEQLMSLNNSWNQSGYILKSPEFWAAKMGITCGTRENEDFISKNRAVSSSNLQFQRQTWGFDEPKCPIEIEYIKNMDSRWLQPKKHGCWSSPIDWGCVDGKVIRQKSGCSSKVGLPLQETVKWYSVCFPISTILFKIFKQKPAGLSISQVWASTNHTKLQHIDQCQWLVVGPPLWKIWLRQLGWLETQY